MSCLIDDESLGSVTPCEESERSMRILMVTNNFGPQVDGVARRVESLIKRFRDLDHKVQVICPAMEGVPSTYRVVRVPAVEHFRNSDFSFPLPVPSIAHRAIDSFAPDVVHSHHPFLLGDTALRVGAERGIPVIFTHHSQYDRFTESLGVGKSDLAKEFINDLDVGYCNLCDAVVAPSQKMVEDLQSRKVTTPVELVPAGVDLQWWSGGSRDAARRKLGIPDDAIVVGHVGRLTPEKNIPFLAESVALFLASRPNARFVVAGVGPCDVDIVSACEKHRVSDRVLTYGILSPTQLHAIYSTMDMFVFASRTESQSLVLAEALACRIPVIAVDAPVVREIINDQVNGRLLREERVNGMVSAMEWIADLDPPSRERMNSELARTAAEYSIDTMAKKMLCLYERAIRDKRVPNPEDLHNWRAKINRIEREVQIWGNFAHAIGDSIIKTVVRGKVI